MAKTVDYLKRRAHTLRMGLFQRLDEICVSDFPTGSPKEVIKLLQDILEKVTAEIDNATNEQILGLICRVIQFYGQFLEYFDNAHTEQTPRGLVQILEDLAQLSPQAKLLVWPQASYNYSIRDILPTLKHTTENLLSDKDKKTLFQPFQGPINLVSFPRVERDDILVHAVFGHELGHPIADEYLQAEQGQPEYQKQLKAAHVALDTAFASEFAGLNTFDLFSYKKQLTDSLLKMRSRGLQELVSDCVAVLLFGPSALFALNDIFSTCDLDTSPVFPDLYPPARFRVRLVKKLMDQEGFSDQLLAVKDSDHLGSVNASLVDMLSHVDAIAANNTDIDVINNDPLLKIAYEWLDKSLPAAIQYAKDKVADLICRGSQLVEEVPELLERIAFGIPPNEIGIPPKTKSVDWRSAIVAAWICKIHGLKKAGETQESMNARDIDHLQKITLRAVEYILLQKRYSAYMAA